MSMEVHIFMKMLVGNIPWRSKLRFFFLLCRTVGCVVGDEMSAWIADSTCDNLQPRHYRQIAALRGQQMSRRVAKQLARQGRALKRYVEDLSEQLYGIYHDMVWD